MRRRTKQRGFTLVELLVVIAIIGMLIGLLLPAVNSAREQGRKMTCSSQVRQLAQATSQYELNKRAYPGFTNWVPMIGATASNQGVMTPGSPHSPSSGTGTYGASFVIELLPFLERNDLYTAWRTTAASSGGATAITSQSAQVSLPLLLCPTNPPAFSGGMPLAYVCNTGCQDATTGTTGVPRDWRENGVFFNRSSDDPRNPSGGSPTTRPPIVKMTSDFITGRDGMSNTLMFSENADAGWYSDNVEYLLGFVWDCSQSPSVGVLTPGGPPPSMYPSANFSRINENRGGTAAGGGSETGGGGGAAAGKPYFTARPSSYHVGGVNVTYCDSRTAFLSDQVEYYVYCLLMSPDGKGTRTPGASGQQQTLLQQGKNFAVPVDDSWLP